MDLTGKNVVFVAGLGGIGYETCKLLIKKDLAYFYILDIIDNPSAVQALQAINPNCKLRYMKFDITNKSVIKSTIAAIIAESKLIDILINGAGILLESNVERTIAINLVGMINTTYEALPYMDKRKDGRGGLVANIASAVGLDPFSPAVAYSSSKFGVIGFTRCMSDQHYFDLTGVAFTALCPGITDTPLAGNISESYTFDYSAPLAEKMARMKTQTPDSCAKDFIKILETCKNGSIWLSDLGNLTEVVPKVFWVPVEK